MIRLLTCIKKALGYKRRQTKNSRDLGNLDQSLTAIVLDLAYECSRVGPGKMISKKIQDSLWTLSQEERTFVVNFNYSIHDFTPFTTASKDSTGKVARYLGQTSSPEVASFIEGRQIILLVTRTTPALWRVVVANCLPVVKFLLETGADINATSDTGSTPINSACYFNLLEMVTFLIDSGADINIPNNKGGTCLMNVVRHVKLVQILVEHGADMYARDCFQKTVLHYAIEEASVPTIHYLLENDENPFQVDVEDHKKYLIAGAMVGECVYQVLVRVLLIKNGLQFGDDPDAFEVLGCTAFINHNSLFKSYWIYAARERSDKGITKTPKRSTAYLEFRRECCSEQQLLELRTASHFLYEVLMIYMRVLGPTHHHLFWVLNYWFYNLDLTHCLEANRMGFLLINLMIQKNGLFDEKFTDSCHAIIVHCLQLMWQGYTIDFTVLIETLKLTRDKVEAMRDRIDQASNSEKKLFDWALNFILLLLYVIVMTDEPHLLSIASVYVRDTLLAAESKNQLRTAKKGFTLLHLAVSKCNTVQCTPWKLVFPSPEVVHFLLSCGAPVNAVAFDGSSPLFVAAASANYMKEVVELLLCNGAHYDQVGPGGDTAMEVLRRCLDNANGDLEPPTSLPCVRSLQCHAALALGKTSFDANSDKVPRKIRDFIKLHIPKH